MHTITAPQALSIGRFMTAQNRSWPRIIRELQRGKKETHWMWYTFPQLRPLAKSETARFFGIADKAEATAYLNHPVLRARLGEATLAVLSHKRNLFSHPDDRKLQSCMTLFAQIVDDATLPNAVLAKFYDGPDQRTLDILAGTYIPPVATAMGRVEIVGRRWEKQAAKEWAAIAAVSQPPERTDPMHRAEVESYLRGFNLSAGAVKLIVEEWMTDQELARDQGYHDCREDSYYAD